MQVEDNFTHSPSDGDAMDVEKSNTALSAHAASLANYEQSWSLFHSMIPDEMQLHIFGQLDIPDLGRAAQACRLWRDMALDRSLWASGLQSLSKASSPTPRVCHTAVEHEGKVYIYGGHNPSPGSNYISDVKSDLLCYDIAQDKWSNVQTEASRRTEHAAIMHEGRMLVVCGYTSESYCALIHAYDFETGEWEELPTGGDAPLPRSACTVAIYDDKLYMFGGWNGHNSNNDFYVYDLKEGEWARIDTSEWTPSARRSHCCIQYRDAMYVWGGYGINQNCDTSVHKFDFKSQEWSIVPARTSGPSARSRARAVRVYDRMIITGGWDRVDHFDDWWEFNLNTGEWSCRHVKLPHPVAQHSAVPWKNSVIVFGGFDDTLKRSCDGFWSYSLGHLFARPA